MSNLTRDHREGASDDATPTDASRSVGPADAVNQTDWTEGQTAASAWHSGAAWDSDHQILELAQEFANVEIVREDAGLVRVQTVTESFEQSVPATLRAEVVEVTRHQIDREVEFAPEPRTEGDVTIIPVVEERAVVVTRLFVVEEIHVRRKVTEEATELPVSLRRQRAVVERLDADGQLMSAPISSDDRETA